MNLILLLSRFPIIVSANTMKFTIISLALVSVANAYGVVRIDEIDFFNAYRIFVIANLIFLQELWEGTDCNGGKTIINPAGVAECYDITK